MMLFSKCYLAIFVFLFATLVAAVPTPDSGILAVGRRDVLVAVVERKEEMNGGSNGGTDWKTKRKEEMNGGSNGGTDWKRGGTDWKRGGTDWKRGGTDW